jgi:hypothetical protein
MCPNMVHVGHRWPTALGAFRVICVPRLTRSSQLAAGKPDFVEEYQGEDADVTLERAVQFGGSIRLTLVGF